LIVGEKLAEKKVVVVGIKGEFCGIILCAAGKE
jgi:hypothetical protein